MFDALDSLLTIRRPRPALWLSIAVIVGTAGPSQAVNFTYTTFPFPANIASSSGGINDSGQVLITYGQPGSALRQPDGTYSSIAPEAGSTITSLYGINNAGQMVGATVGNATAVAHGVFRDINGQYSDLYSLVSDPVCTGGTVSSVRITGYGAGINNI